MLVAFLDVDASEVLDKLLGDDKLVLDVDDELVLDDDD